ncbi:MAG: hypothetical protein ACJAS1_004159 [Oleiphilaceae bacterium]|jgi:hypothetical protein
MTIWILLSVIWAALLLFTIVAPQKWHVIVLKENNFWLNNKLISESLIAKMIKFETGLLFKFHLFIVLVGFISIAFTVE